jgi:hypothetical protein
MAISFSRIANPLRESFFRNTGVSHRNIIGLMLGLTAAILLLSSRVLTPASAAIFFVAALILTLVLFVAVRPYIEQSIDKFAWGLLVIVVLGFGFGTLIYQYREWLKWVWRQYRRINEPHELVLEFLFLLGVILGVFVVRNWAKEQEAFTKSLSGLLGGTFIAGVFGESLKGQGLTTMQALTYYGLGFVMSASLNLLVAARLTANYTNKRSISSRALLDFLYGSERTKLIDGYFLKNFQEDPDYAKRWLTDALVGFRTLVQREFAEHLEVRRQEREKERRNFVTGLSKEKTTIERKQRRLRDLEPECSKRKDAEDDLQELEEETEYLSSLPDRSSKQESRLRYIRQRVENLETEITGLKVKCDSNQFEQWQELTSELREIKPSYFYELITIECEPKEPEGKERTPAGAKEDREYTVVYRQIGLSPSAQNISSEMFRVGVTSRWQDTLEYITAPGEFRVSFPYQGSVSGLALEFHENIVMDRDSRKRFRNKKYTDGVCPRDIEQDRGLDEINFLSYIAIPLVSRKGSPTENPVGVVTIDTKLFVTRSELDGRPLQGSEGIFRVRMKRAKLSEYGSNLYYHEDKIVKYIEDLAEIMTPVLELYSKCRVGAT